jgi:O-acetyl-ADP-ribose deacetylase (regulator of RNase III)
MTIRYVKGDVTKPEDTGGIRVIAHSCNDVGGWGPEGGSVADAIGKRWPEARSEYKSQFLEGTGLKLGEVQLVDVGDKLWVANCIAQRGYRRPGNLQPFKYEAFETCMGFLVKSFVGRNASIHMPRVGTKLGGADWHAIEYIIERTLGEAELNVTVYDL